MFRLPLPTSPAEWTRRRLQILLGIGLTVGVLLLFGAIWYVVDLVGSDDPPASLTTSQADPGPPGSQTNTSEDELAARRLPTAGLVDSQPGPLTTQTTGRITLPSSTTVGPARVPSGYPHTPQGATAQLIAIDRAALEGASIQRAQEVITDWAAPGGPTVENWSGVAAVATFLAAGGFPSTGAPEVAVVAEPSMGFIKATVGSDFVIPCIDFVLTVTAGEVHRAAAADCQRMIWVPAQTRWIIAAGPEPAPAPSVWPGGPASIDAGYQWLAQAP